MDIADLRWHPISTTQDMSQRMRDEGGQARWFIRKRERTIPTPVYQHFEYWIDGTGEMCMAPRDLFEVLCRVAAMRPEKKHEQRWPGTSI